MVFSHKLFKSTLPFAARRLSSSQGGSKGTGPGIGLLVGVGSFSGMAYLLTHRESSTYHALCDNLVMPALRLLDPEKAHNLAIYASSLRLSPVDGVLDESSLRTNVWGLEFSNVIGVAAGFDKHAEAMEGLTDAGFGFIEVGSITPEPQAGNPKPRMFRLTEDEAVINRYGFNSHGIEVCRKRLKAYYERESARRENVKENNVSIQFSGDGRRRSILGVNLGKNKTSPSAEDDYTRGVRSFAPFADYLVVNVSSPNTPGLRDLQGREKLKKLLTAVKQELDGLSWESYNRKKPPLLVKVAPDLTQDDLTDIAWVAKQVKIDGIIISNTTNARPESLQSKHRNEGGGLSGKPLMKNATRQLKNLYKATEGKIPLVGVGGVSSGDDAYEKIRAGASLVQIYSALSFQGPGMVPRVKRRLAELLKRDGYNCVRDAVGADHRDGS
eukprot:g3603.t1